MSFQSAPTTSHYSQFKKDARENLLIKGKPSIIIRVILLESAVAVSKWLGAISKCLGWTTLNSSRILIVHDILLYWKHKKQMTEAKVREGRRSSLDRFVLNMTFSYQPVLNSTWASKKPTTGAVAAFQPCILALMRPSRLLFLTIFTRPG